MRFTFILIGLFVVLSCVRRPPPEPQAMSLQEITEESSSPQRAASMTFVEKGRSELNSNRFERAVSNLTRAIEIDSSNAYAYFFLGLTRYRTEKWHLARDLFRRAGDLYTHLKGWRAESYAYAGECSEKLNQSEQARKFFQKAQDSDSANTRSQEGLKRLEGGNGG